MSRTTVREAAWTQEHITQFVTQVVKRPWLWDDYSRIDPLASMYQTLADPTCVWFHVFTDDTLSGVMWFSSVIPGHKATSHVVIWDRRALGKTQLGIDAMAMLVAKHNVKRIEAFIPEHNAKALAYAKRLGFAHEGTLRCYHRYENTFADTHVLSVIVNEV